MKPSTIRTDPALEAALNWLASRRGGKPQPRAAVLREAVQTLCDKHGALLQYWTHDDAWNRQPGRPPIRGRFTPPGPEAAK